jgi:transcriptional regulator with XRE-family HTH domain
VRSVVVQADEEACVAVSKGTFRLGELLRLARHAIGSDQEAFGQRVGVSSRTVSRWETAAQALTAEQRPIVVRAVAAAPRDIVDELAALLGVPSPYASAAPAAPATRALPTVAELRAVFDAVVFAASEERDVLPRHLRAFGVELLLAVDRAGVSARDAAALVAAREGAPGRNATKGG